MNSTSTDAVGMPSVCRRYAVVSGFLGHEEAALKYLHSQETASS